MKKKFIGIIAAASLAFLLSGCTVSDNNQLVQGTVPGNSEPVIATISPVGDREIEETPSEESKESVQIVKVEQEESASSTVQAETESSETVAASLEQTEESIPTPPDPVNAGMEIHFIDIGQGDAILVKSDNAAMLVDGGYYENRKKVVNYLQNQGVTSLDYYVATHPDSDHIGVGSYVLENIPCSTVWMPSVNRSDCTSFDKLIETINNSNIPCVWPDQNSTYSLGSCTVTVLSGQNYHEDINDMSIVLRIDAGSTSIILTGDAEYEEEKELISNGNLSANILKVGHHGSTSSTSDKFLSAVNPKYAVISCADGNDYGHPRAEVLNKLRASGVELFRTDEQGSIIAYSDGSTITWNTPSSTSWKAGEPKQKEIVDVADATYVLNNSSMKIHLPSCKSVQDIADRNRENTTKTKEELLELGYVGCKSCNP